MLVRLKDKNPPDYVSELVGDTRRVENWSEASLVQACVGPLVKRVPVSFSRFYFLITPRVVVDYEPAPVHGQFYCEAKRTWCHEHGIVYVPIFLRDRLTRDGFADRLVMEREALAQYERDHRDARSIAAARRRLKSRPQGYTISDPEVQTLIDEETAIRITLEDKAGFKVSGVARTLRIGKIRKDVEREFLAKVRDGSVGHQLRYRQSAVAARG